MSEENIAVYRLADQKADEGMELSAEQVLKVHYEHAILHGKQVVFTAPKSLSKKVKEMILLVSMSYIGLKAELVKSPEKLSTEIEFDEDFNVPQEFQKETLAKEKSDGFTYYYLKNVELLLKDELSRYYYEPLSKTDSSNIGKKITEIQTETAIFYCKEK